MTNILDSIKKLLGISSDYDDFDTDIIMHINSVLSTIAQIGVGPKEGFTIDQSSVWSEFIVDSLTLNLVKSYVYLKVRLLFDPPQSSAVLNAINAQISELEWRISVESKSTS